VGVRVHEGNDTAMTDTHATGKVFLVGAGPGDPRLITVRGLKLLGEADVVIHDSLAPSELLNYTKPGAELIYAGKRGGIPRSRRAGR